MTVSTSLPPPKFLYPLPIPAPAANLTSRQFSRLMIRLPSVSDTPTYLKYASGHATTLVGPPFSFFNDFPREVRDEIYTYLVGTVVVHTHGHSDSLQVSSAESLAAKRRAAKSVRDLTRHRQRHRNFLCLSRQFFWEVRNVIHNQMMVKFERRWDFIGAFINGSLQTNSTVPTVSNSITLFPLHSRIFGNIRKLHLNLCSSADFNGIVFTAEARRVTTAMLQIVEHNMTSLRSLVLTVDERSRVCSCAMVFLPDAWFLGAILAIPQLTFLNLVPGPSYARRGNSKEIYRKSMAALNAVLSKHTKMTVFERQSAWSGIAGRCLQIKVGRRMLEQLPQYMEYQATTSALALKVVMLESIVSWSVILLSVCLIGAKNFANLH